MEQMRTIKARRVGTFTAGLLLVLFGVMFLVHFFVPAISYVFIFRCWPGILILLGIELLLASRNREEVTYDKGAVFLIFLLAFFAMGMAGADLVMQYAIQEGAFVVH